MPTVLEALMWPTVTIDVSSIIPHGNTDVRPDMNIKNWREWHDFTYDMVVSLFERLLSHEYVGSREPAPLAKDLKATQESEIHTILCRFPLSVVNNAMESIKKTPPYYGAGTWCSKITLMCNDVTLIPDWSCISDGLAKDGNGKYLNLVPGDTKVSTKWNPRVNKFGEKEWMKPVRQIAAYTVQHCVRYGFIATDQDVVVIRITRVKTATDTATNRPRRSGARYTTQSSDISTELGNLRLSVNNSSDEAGSPLSWAYSMEYKTIPWNVHGKTKLNGKLTITALAWMSLYGNNNVDYSYPDLEDDIDIDRRVEENRRG